MSQRYKVQELEILRLTHNTSYQRKGQGLTSERNINKNKSFESSPLIKNRAKSQDKPERKMSVQLTVRFLKDKLTEIMSLSSNKGMKFINKQQSSDQQCKKSDSFRITAYRNAVIRKNRKKKELETQKLSLTGIQNQFQVREANIQRRQSANNPSIYQNIGFTRNFLRFHGQNKCFERAIRFKHFKQVKKNEDKLICLLQKQRNQLEAENSLEYSSEEFELSNIDEWRERNISDWMKKNMGDMQWSGFTNAENSYQ